MKKLIALLVTVGLTSLAFASPGNAATPSRHITITATGTVKVTPDAVRINSTVSVVSSSATAAKSESSKVSSAVRTALLANGILAKDIKSQNLTVYPEYTYNGTTSTLTGYRASQSFEIVVVKAENAGAVVDAIVKAGGDSLQINAVTPFVTDNAAASLSARQAAVKNAKAKALSYASLLGVKLGSVMYLVENSAPTYTPLYGVAKAEDSTSIDLGQQDVTISITVQWALK